MNVQCKLGPCRPSSKVFTAILHKAKHQFEEANFRAIQSFDAPVDTLQALVSIEGEGPTSSYRLAHLQT